MKATDSLPVNRKILFRLALFFAPFLSLTFLTLLFGYAPLGDGSAAASGDTQYLSYIASLRSYLTGNGFFGFAELATDASFLHVRYAGSPFTWLNALFPVSLQAGAAFLLLAVKSGLASLSFSLYLAHRRQTLPQPLVFLLSFSYALPAWLALTDGLALLAEQLILLPLLLLALERFFESGKSGLLIFSLTFIFMTGYAVAYATVLFALLALLLSFVEGRVRCEQGKEAAKKLAFSLLLAILFALPFLLHALTKLSAIGSVNTYSGSWLYRLPLLLLGFWPGPAIPDFPIFYVGVLPLLLFPLFFASSKFSGRYRACFGIVLALLVTYFFFFNPFGGALSFGLSFLVLLLTADFLASDSAYKKILLTVTAAILLIFPMILQKLSYRMPSDGNALDILSPLYGMYLPLALIFVAVLALSALLERQSLSRALAALLVTLVLLDGVAATFWRTSGKTFLETEKVTEINVEETAELLFSRAKITRSPIERTRLTIEGNAKIPYERDYLLGADKENALSPALSKFLSGIGANTSADLGTAPMPFADALLGVSYTLTDSTCGAHYSLIKKQGDLSLYRAAALPTVFASSKDVLTFEGKESSPFLYTNAFLSALLGQKQEFYHPLSDVTVTQSGDTVTLKGNVTKTGTLCFYSESVGSPNLNVTVATKSYRPYENGKNSGILPFDKVESGNAAVAVFNDGYPADKENFYTADDQLLENAVNTLREGALQNAALKGGVLTGEVTLDASTPVLMTTLPYDADSTVRIDGKAAKTASVQGLLAVSVGEGTHTVSIERPASFGISLLPSAIGLGGTLAAAVVLFLKKTKEAQGKAK